MEIQKVIDNILDEEYNGYFPIFNTNGLIIEKKGNQYWLMHQNKLPLTINQTTSDIIELANGENSLQTIIKKMIEKYEVDYDTAKTDVLNILYEFHIKDYISWGEKKNLFEMLYFHKVGATGITYKVPDYSEIVSDYESTEKMALVSGGIKKKVKYTPANIKASIDSRHEVFYEMFQNEKLKALISLKPMVIKRPIFTCIFYYLEYFFIDEHLQINKEEFNDFIKWCVKWELAYSRMFYDEENFYITAVVEEANLLQYLEFGFQYVGKLVKECSESDMIMLQKRIEL